jgi:hypothetical protein
MAFNYAALTPVFEDIIKEFQMGTVNYVKTFLTQNPDDPMDFTRSEEVTTLDAVVTGPDTERADDSNILDSDKFVIISYNSLPSGPKDSDYFDIDGKRHQIIMVYAAPSAGEPIIYRVQCRSL